MNCGRQPLRFTRGRHSYLITQAYTGEVGYVGLRDGRIIARSTEPSSVARALIEQKVRGCLPAD